MFSSVSGNNNRLKYYSVSLIILIPTASYFHYSDMIIENMPNYYIYIFIAIIIVSLLFLAKKKERQLITISDGFLFINKQEEKSRVNYKLACNEIKFFETKFNEIIFYYTNNEKLSVKLDGIKSDKQRWELKELLRRHVPENKHHRNTIEEDIQ